MLRGFLTLVLLAAPAFAADWVEYRSGPFHVYSDAGDRPARERLNELEQLRFVLGAYLGKPDLAAIWPIDVVLFAREKEYAPHILPSPLIHGGSATLAAWAADAGSKSGLRRDLLRAITEILIRDNSGRMPPEIETALEDLFSTIDVVGTKVSLGAPLPAGELSGNRLRTWAKLQMLVTQPEYAGKLRVYINNLQQAGGEEVAVRNAYDLKLAEFNSRVDGYTRAGHFQSAPVTGEALSPNRDFIEKNAGKADIDGLISELDAKGNSFPPDSPRGLLAKNTLPALELAIRANPKWAEPHFAAAALETDPARKIARLKMAASLDPRNPSYWQTLAETQAQAELFADADKSWTAAERAASSPAERDRIHAAKLKLADDRAAADVEARKRRLADEASELQRIKDEAAAEVHQAEAKANAHMGGDPGAIKNAVPFSDPALGNVPPGAASGLQVSGTLTRVDCVGASLRITLQLQNGNPLKLLIRDPRKLTVAPDSGDAEFACGLQRPARKIELQHDGKADAKFGTVGDVLVVKFP